MKFEFRSFGTIYQLWDETNMARGASYHLKDAQAKMKPGWTMEIQDDQRAREYGVHRRVRLATYSYPQAMKLRPGTFPDHFFLIRG